MSNSPPFGLDPKHRRALAAGGAPHIPLTPAEAAAIEPGQEVVIERFRLWISVVRAERDKRGEWHLVYIVHNHRPRLIRRNPHGMDVRDVRRRLDRYGTPVRVSDQDEAEAEEASHYTSSEALAVTDADEAVDRETQEVYAAEAAVKKARGDSDQVGVELERIKRLPARSRIIELHKLASDRGVDVRDAVKAFERNLAKQIGEAA